MEPPRTDSLPALMGMPTPEQRAWNYLQRICKLTGTLDDELVSGYYLMRLADGTEFRISASAIWRKAIYNQSTCLRSPKQVMPPAEMLANILLQLWRNPQLFDLWRENGYRLFSPSGQDLGRYTGA
jgi:hypothetical protein